MVPPPLPYPPVEQRAGRLAAAAVALGIFILGCFAPEIFNDGDTGWHLATGKWILGHGAVPDIDPFSHTRAGSPWTAHEWLAEIIMATMLGLGGWPLLALTVASALGVLILVIGRELARWLDAPKVILVLLLVIVMLFPYVLARPQVFAWPLLAGWTVILLHAREAGRAPPLWAAVLMLVWANLHGSFIFGLGIAGLMGLEALVTGPDRRAVLIGWGRFGALALVAALLTPHGIHGLLFPLMVSRMTTLDFISEWEATQFPRHATFALPLLLTIFVLLWRGVKVPPLRLLLLCLMFYMAFAHVRHHQILAIVGSLLLAAPIGMSFGRLEVGAPPRRLSGVLVSLLVVAIAARLMLPGTRPDSAEYPGTAIAKLPEDLRRQPVLNEYGFGGALILAGIAPFIDGRADVYGDGFINGFRRVNAGDMAAFDRAARRWHIGWTFFRPDTPIVATLDRHPGWQRRYTDRWSVIHVRRTPTRSVRGPAPAAHTGPAAGP